MCFAAKVGMTTYIKVITESLDKHPKLKQWFWFVFLWLSGMSTFAILAYSIKFMMFAF